MALVTVQRSPSPSTDPDSEAVEGEEGVGSGRSPLRNRSLSESYFTVRGAALILPQGERPRKSSKKSHGGDIQHHLQSMLYLLRHEDRIKVAVKLEASDQEGHQRYMALVSTVGRQDTEESVIIGMDYVDHVTTIGIVLPIYNGTQIRLSGDGGFSVKISVEDRNYHFKPVSVQAMWSALQSLQKAVRVADDETYIPKGLTHTWIQYYTSQIENCQPEFLTQWNIMEGVEVCLSTLVTSVDEDGEKEMKAKITLRLTEVMMKVDLDEATSKSLREAVEERLGGASIRGYREYFDMEMLRILGQMDAPTQILDFLFLGTEWNASNIDELTENGVKYILNVTQEIDNFFPHQLKYMNVRVEDVETTHLMPFWDKTYRFISKARKNGSKVLVHCKRGISRSASTVIAYLMKENKWSLDDSFKFVKDQRQVINPNCAFREQLRTYEGILNASNQRTKFKSQSVENLLQRTPEEEELPGDGVFLEGADLYRQMFESGYQPASEDEVLQSLSKGRGPEDQDMIHLGADLETGSRSTDSLEESFPDIPSPTPEQEEVLFTKKRVTDGEYTVAARCAGVVAVGGEVAGLELIRQEYASDVEDDPMGIYSRGRRSPNMSPVISISEAEGETSSVSAQTRLRPDNSWIKLEVESESIQNDASSSKDDDTLVPGSPPKFYIGEDSESPKKSENTHDKNPVWKKNIDSLSPRVRSASMGEGKDGTSAKSEIDAVKLSNRSRTASLGSRKLNTSNQEEEELEDVPQPEIVSDVVDQVEQEVVIDRRAQFGITHYYKSEQIPWCPGTVQKIKSDFSKYVHSSDEESDSGQKESIHDKPECDQPLVKISVTDVTEVPSKGDNSERLTQSCTETLPPDEAMDVSEEARKRPQSVYEAEDIQLPEGMVRMFKEMLETNKFSSEEDDSLDSRPVQRSASLKEVRGGSSKSRRSERRRTCSPILSPEVPSPPPHESNALLVPGDVAREVTPDLQLSDDAMDVGEEENAAKNLTVFKCGNEEVPLEKGIVKKHKQDFESRSDHEARKRLSSESSVSSVTLDTQDMSQAKEDAQKSTGPFEPENPDLALSKPDSMSTTDSALPPAAQTNGTQYSNSSVISERLIGTVREQKLLIESKDLTEQEPTPTAHPPKRQKKEDSSAVDPQTMAKMRELGCEFLNQPPEQESKEQEIEDLTLVKQAVRNLEKEVKVKKPERKIIIIEEENGKKTEAKTKNQPISEKSRSLDDSGNVGARRTRQWVKDGGCASFESDQNDSKTMRTGLILNLDETCPKGEAEHHMDSVGSVSPRSDTEPSIVRHLVGRFEKDLKSPCDNDGSSSNRSSVSVGDFGLCFADTKKKKDDCSESDIEMRTKTTDMTLARPLRPKSADHIGGQNNSSQVKVQGQGEDGQSQQETTEDSDKGDDCRKIRRVHGQTNPVTQRLGASPFYNTM